MNCCGQKSEPFIKSSLIEAGKSIIKHYINAEYDAFSSTEIKEKRIKACDSCDMLGEFFGKKQCTLCKCFIEPKAALIDQFCEHPKGSKWEEEKK